jgi:hypothetical protein
MAERKRVTPEGTKLFQAYLPADLYDRLKLLTQLQRTTLTGFATDLFTDAVDAGFAKLKLPPEVVKGLLKAAKRKP